MAIKQDYDLRLLTESDLKKVLDWRNSPRIRENMYTDHIISLDEHQNWFNSIKNNPKVSYHICTYQGNPIGLICFTEIDSDNEKCSWGFYLGETNAPFGSGLVMEFIALEYAFDELKIRKLCCEVLSFNQKVIKLHKKFGFEQEGYFTAHVQKNNQYEDVIFLSLFKEKWLTLREQLQSTVFS